MLETLLDQSDPEPEYFWLMRLDDPCIGNGSCPGTLCAICGLHIKDRAREEGWRSECVLISDPAREYEHLQTHQTYPKVEQEPSVASTKSLPFQFLACSRTQGCQFYRGDMEDSSFRKDFVYSLDRRNLLTKTSNTLYFPTHKACLQVALKIQLHRLEECTPLRGLFRVLRHRFQSIFDPTTKLLSQKPHLARSRCHDHELPVTTVINFSGFQNTDGIERGYISQLCFQRHYVDGDHYIAGDPYNIPALTKTLLKNLEPMKPFRPRAQEKRFRIRLGRLPNELKTLVLRHLTANHEWPPTCTRLLSNRCWKAMFDSSLPCMSWLWDLDHRLVRRTDLELQLDWELLFRKISQSPKTADCFSGSVESDYQVYRDVLSSIPPGLEGRRRLWKLLDEMYIGDRRARWGRAPFSRTTPTAFTKPFANIVQMLEVAELEETPVYWGSAGELLGRYKKPGCT